MHKVKSIIVKIPLLGYLLRILFAVVLLPRILTSMRHLLHAQQQSIASLEEQTLRTNRKILDMTESKPKA